MLTAYEVPKSLSDEQMALLNFRSKLGQKFLLRLVTVDDETLVHYYETENKLKSRKCVEPGPPRPKKLKRQPSGGKAMATVLWDAKVFYHVGLINQERYNNWSVPCKPVRPAENSHP